MKRMTPRERAVAREIVNAKYYAVLWSSRQARDHLLAARRIEDAGWRPDQTSAAYKADLRWSAVRAQGWAALAYRRRVEAMDDLARLSAMQKETGS